MNSILNQLLVDQIKEKGISLRQIHSRIEQICENDPGRDWISLSTLERRFKKPESINSSELELIRDATRSIISGSSWINIKRHITSKVRSKYSHMIDDALGYGFALHQNLADYDNTLADDEFVKQIAAFYQASPKDVQKRWNEILPTYLMLPDIAKAALLCCSYIGKSEERDEERTKRILKFLDLFPVFQGINIVSNLTDLQISSLGKILLLSATATIPCNTPDDYRRYAINKDLIVFPKYDSSTISTDEFVKLVVRYKRSITDFSVTARDFIRGLCFTLYIDRVEWLLAYATSLFFYDMDELDQRTFLKRDYHDRGCTGFRFTDKELDYLCCLIYFLENDV